MKINWIVRFKNKAFWVAIIPAMFGVELNIAGLSDQLIAIVGTAFSVLALVGIVNDPTVASLSDSEQAMTYTEPRSDK